MLKMPRKYLSWSQYDLWNKSKRSYSRRYFIGEPAYVTPELSFGSSVATSEEEGKILHPVQQMVKEQTNPEFRESQWVLMRRGYYLMGYMDGINTDYSKVTDHKTGKKSWSLDRLKENGQQKLYAAMVWKLTGIIPESEIVWMETQNIDGDRRNGIEFTGHFEIFNYKFNELELEKMLKDCDRVANEISLAYQMFLTI